MPNQVSAGIGNLRVFAFSGFQDGHHWAHMEIMEGSYGGRHGLDAVDTLYANTREQPRGGHREPPAAAGGALRVQGRRRGGRGMARGIGTVREFTFLADGGFSLEGDGHSHAPWGFAGRADGYTASLKLLTAGGDEVALPSKVPYKGRVGDRLVSLGPSGGDGQVAEASRSAT